GAPRAPRRLPRTRSRARRPRAPSAPRPAEDSVPPPGTVPGAPPSASHAVAAAGPVSPSGRRLAVEEDLVVVAWSPAMGGVGHPRGAEAGDRAAPAGEPRARASRPSALRTSA